MLRRDIDKCTLGARERIISTILILTRYLSTADTAHFTMLARVNQVIDRE